MPNQYRSGTVRVLIRMPEELRDRLKTAADSAGSTMSDIARDAIADRLDLIEKLTNPGKEEKK